jgi:hypothetical protein
VEVLVLQVFVSLMLVVSSLLLFAKSVRQRDHEHADRLALLPLQPDDGVCRDTQPPDPESRTNELEGTEPRKETAP